MPGYITSSKAKVIILLAITVLLSACRLQKTPDSSTLRIMTMQNQRSIDTYNYRGTKMIVYDTTVIVLRETGDTVRTDHRRSSTTDNTILATTDSVTNTATDSVATVVKHVTTNILTPWQKAMYKVGIGAVVIIAVVAIIKIAKIFKVKLFM